MNSKGFTLLEVIIAVTILAFITLFTSQSIQRALRQKGRITKDIERIALVRDALKVIERDVNLAFNFRDPSIKIYNDAQAERKKRKKDASKPAAPAGSAASPVSPPPPPPSPTGTPDEYAPKKEVILTQFIGKAESIHFTSRSFVRTQRDSQVGDQAEVGYFLKNCKSRSNLNKQSQCLWRRVDPYIDDKTEEGGEETALLEDVVTFELRYLGPGKDDWVDDWSSAEGADDVTRGKFPSAVEVTLEMKPEPKNRNQKTKSTRMTMVASIRNPNNPVAKPATEGLPAAPATGAGAPDPSGAGTGR